MDIFNKGYSKTFHSSFSSIKKIGDKSYTTIKKGFLESDSEQGTRGLKAYASLEDGKVKKISGKKMNKMEFTM